MTVAELIERLSRPDIDPSFRVVVSDYGDWNDEVAVERWGMGGGEPFVFIGTPESAAGE